MRQQEKWVNTIKIRLAFRGSEMVNLIKNPSSSEMKELAISQLYGIRAIILPTGDFYSISLMNTEEEDNLEVIHDELLSVIPNISDYSGWEYEEYLLEEFLSVVSHAPNFYNFQPAESYNIPNKIMKVYVQDYATALKKKNSGMTLRM